MEKGFSVTAFWVSGRVFFFIAPQLKNHFLAHLQNELRSSSEMTVLSQARLSLTYEMDSCTETPGCR